MNTLVVGFDKTPILDHLPDRFLLIDDGPLIDQLALPPRRAATVLDFSKHSFNPLKDMDDLRARELWDVLKAAFPEGENTLTKAHAEFQILSALKDKPRSLVGIIKDSKDTQYAYELIQKLLLSDTLKDVLTRPTNFSFKRTLIARLDRARFGDFVCFVLGNFLISQYPGAVVVPDFGFYACASHARLIRQDRLIAGITSLEEAPAKLRNQLVQIERKIGSQCTPEDAEILARYAGIAPSTRAHREFVEELIKRPG